MMESVSESPLEFDKSKLFDNIDIIFFLKYHKNLPLEELLPSFLIDVGDSSSIFRYFFENDILSEDEILNIQSEYFKIDILGYELGRYVIDDCDKLNEYYKKGVIRIRDERDGVCGELFLRYFDVGEGDCDRKFIASKKVFELIITENTSETNSRSAIFSQNLKNPNFSANNIKLLKSNTRKSLLIIFTILFVFLKQPFVFFINIIYGLQNILRYLVINNFFFVKYNKLKINHKISEISDESCPIYTILIPLYKEQYAVKNIIKSIKLLDYPKNKLDVKLLVEEDDDLTLNVIKQQKLPFYFDLIIIPVSEPRTKPKALNYAIPFIKGDFLVIYDAEDVPDTKQLKMALLEFKNLGDEYSCIQAKLNFYNKENNLLTKLFSIEYSFWFDIQLMTLSNMSLPITLGGTSNHFRVDTLKKIGFWDPFNVTEDAELGLRLRFKNYKIGMIDSITYEESPQNIKAWFKQRVRWIKGFFITFLIFLKQNPTEIKFKDYITFFIFLGTSSISFLLSPFLLYYTFFDEIIINKIIYYICMCNILLGHLSLFLVSFYITLKDDFIESKNVTILMILKNIFLSLCFPIYFTLHICASYYALYELFVKPFQWNKTDHFASYEDVEIFRNRIK